MKRTLTAAALAVCLAATPAHAVGPLAAMVIGYVKQALKEKVIAYAKEKAMGLAGDALADVPGASMLGLVPGMGAVARPSMPAEAQATLQAAGFNNTNAAPLTDADWAEYEQTVTVMARAAGGDEAEVPDVAQLRAALAAMPQMNGMIRMQLQQFREIKAEQARMREAYAAMPEGERGEVVAELAKAFREQPAEVQPHALHVLNSDALGLPDDLKRRLLAALKADVDADTLKHS